MKEILWLNKINAPSVKSSFCAYLDILNYRHKMLIADIMEDSNDFLRDLIEISRKNVNTLNNQIQLKICNDKVVLGIPDYNELDTFNKHNIRRVFKDIARFQFQIVLSGYIIKGALSYGGLFINDSLIYGDALFSSADLRNEAIYPRIILSEGMKNKVIRYLNAYDDGPDDFIPLRAYILRDDTGRFFINYLSSSLITSLDPPDYRDLHYHKTVIDILCRSLKNDGLYFEELSWVKQYHNYFISFCCPCAYKSLLFEDVEETNCENIDIL